MSGYRIEKKDRSSYSAVEKRRGGGGEEKRGLEREIMRDAKRQKNKRRERGGRTITDS